MEQQIGQIVKALQPQSQSMASPQHFAKSQSVALVPPTNDAECQALAEWAETAPTSSEAPATLDDIAEALMFLNSVLPSRNFDEQAGEQRTAVFVQILSPYSKRQIDYMTRRAATELDWFPTPKQCLALLNDAPKGFNPRAEAKRLVHSYEHERFLHWLFGLSDMSDEEMNTAPEKWKRVAECQGWIRLLDDGTYKIRKSTREKFV